MANTVFGPYTSTSWTAGVTALNQTNMNHLETQASVALHGFNPDLVGAGFILSGCAASGTVGTTTVNIASGVAYTVMTDGTVGRITVGTATQTTSALSSTYNLYLQPDGTFYWSTSNTPQTNSLYLATVATNGSGQIATITDQRTLNFTLWSGAAGTPTLTNLIVTGSVNYGAGASGSRSLLAYSSGNHENEYWTPQSGATAQGHLFIGYDGATFAFPFSVGPTGVGAKTAVSNTGVVTSVAGQATAGSFGVPVIVAQAINTHVTATTQQTILTFTPPADGLYQCFGSFSYSNGSATHLWFYCSFTDPNVAGGPSALMHNETGAIFNLAVSSTAGTTSPCWSPAFYAKASNAITVIYQDNAGTPGDWVTAVLCRLS